MKSVLQKGIFALIIAIFVSFHAEAQLFRPFTSFQVIRTERFDIIFPPESERSARYLATFADPVYEEMSSMLGLDYPGRIQVTFAPHTDRFNGYYSIFPGSHIVLFDTPMDVEWTVFMNNLRSLFIHELAHAISFSTRSLLYRNLHRIFGNWVTPALFNAPLFMVEGITVSFESMESQYGIPIQGRANDPRTRQYLRQAIHENAFHSPQQVSGLYDIPQRVSYYDYGGLFSYWLLENFGIYKYAELWQIMGRTPGFPFFVYSSGFYRLFKIVYNMDFLDAWDEFRDSLALNGLEENPDQMLTASYRYFSQRNFFYQALKTGDGNLFFLNIGERKAGILNIESGELREYNTGASYDLDVNHDSSLMLISGYDYSGERAIAVVNEYRTDGRRTGRSVRGLYRARYFRDGVIGLGSDLHNNNIVFDDFRGNREILLQGDNELMFSGPQPLDDERIVFIASAAGMREIWVYDYSTREVFRIEIRSGQESRYYNIYGNFWQFARNLNVSGGLILFSHNENDRMYKLGLINLDTMEVIFNNRDFSGGVFYPAVINETIYYIGSFNSHDNILQFPEELSALSGDRLEIHLVKIETNTGLPHDFAHNSLINDSLYNDLASNIADIPEPRRYYALPYMNPFQFWLPIPLLRGYGSDMFGGMGILSMMSDPTDRNLAVVEAYWDRKYRMALINEAYWVNTGMGFPFSISFYDGVTEGVIPYRSTSIDLSGSFSGTVRENRFGLNMGGGYIRNSVFNGKISAYEWENRAGFFYLSAGFRYANPHLSFNLNAISNALTFLPRLTANFNLRFDSRFPFGIAFYAAYDMRGMSLSGFSNTYGSLLSFGNIPAMVEYGNPAGLNLNWLGGAHLTVNLFSFEIQNSINHFYFNRFNAVLSLRNQIYDAAGHSQPEGVRLENLHLIQSLVLRLSMEISVLPVMQRRLSIEPYVFGAWKLSNTLRRDGSKFYFNLGFNIRF